MDITNPDNKSDVNSVRGELVNAVDNWTIAAELALDPTLNPDTAIEI
jgi:hypothetical protein